MRLSSAGKTLIDLDSTVRVTGEPEQAEGGTILAVEVRIEATKPLLACIAVTMPWP